MDDQEDSLFQKQIRAFVEQEFYKVTAQRSLYMALNAFALCLFAVVLFLMPAAIMMAYYGLLESAC